MAGFSLQFDGLKPPVALGLTGVAGKITLVVRRVSMSQLESPRNT
jgi:hypothetical protein